MTVTTADLPQMYEVEQGQKGVGWFDLASVGERVSATVVSSDGMRVVSRLGSKPKLALASAIRGLFANTVNDCVPDAGKLAGELLGLLAAERAKSPDASLSDDLFAPRTPKTCPDRNG